MKRLFILILVLLLPAVCNGTTYYVDNYTGANSNTGLVGNPWKELPGTVNPTGSTSGWATIAAGDTIVLTSGQEWNKGVLINSSYYNNGTAASYITITVSSPGTRAVFDFNESDVDLAANGAAIQLRRDYFVIEYLEIREITKSGNCTGVYIGNADANDYNKIQYCYIHDIIDTTVIAGSVDSCTGENFSYGIVIVWATGTEIAHNIIKNIDKKFIATSESYGGSNLIHHNVCYNESTFIGDPIDHGIVVSSLNGGNEVYNNILWNNHKYYGRNYAINLVEAGGSNKVYNNIIRGYNIGITSRTSGAANDGNEIINNTIYLADNPATLHTCYYNSDNNMGIYLSNSDNNIVRNNLIYYPELTGSYGYMIYIDSSADTNTITNNLFYRTGTDEAVRVDNVARSINWLNDTFSDGDASDNVVVDPGLSGGSYPVANLPSGFDANGLPTPSGLSLSNSSGAKSIGYTMGAPYTTDIMGVTRPNGDGWDVGAYEYSDLTAVALAHTGTDTVTVNVNDPVFFYAKDSVGSGNDYGNLTGFEWDFDSSDGVDYGDSISSFTFHRYSAAGTYTATLRVTDEDEGATSTDTVTVTVQAVPAGDTFYVTKTGSDSNDCTDNTTNACLTIAGALGKASVGAGDTIVVGAGSYNESIIFTKGGTENNPLTIQAATGTTPELYYTSNAYLVNFAGYDWITWDGFEFDGRSAADAILIPNTSTHISIKNSEIHHIDSSNLSSAKAYSGLTLSPTRETLHTSAAALWTYIYNTTIHNNAPSNVNISSWGNVFEDVDIYDPGTWNITTNDGEDNYVLTSAGNGNYFKGGSNKRTQPAQTAARDNWELYGASNVTIDGVEINGAEADLILCDTGTRSTDKCDNLVFVNNIIYRAYAFDQNQLRLQCAPRFKVLNNTFYGRLDPIYIRDCSTSASNSNDGLVANNIFMGSGAYSCSNDYGKVTITATDNHYYNCTAGTGEVNTLTSDPLLTDPQTDGNGDFSLTESSPGIDEGYDTGYPVDYIGTARATYDIGAYEYYFAGPIRSNGSPTSNVSYATTTTLSLNTLAASSCKYSTVSGTDYGDMAGTFDTTGGTTHSEPGVSISVGSNTFYVRCYDTVANTTDYTITFTVLAEAAPGITLGGSGTITLGGSGTITIAE